MAKNSSLDVSTWIRSLVSISRILLLPIAFLASIFLYHQIRVDELILRVTTNYWVPSRHVFCFNGIELEFSTIMGEPEIDDLIFPTMVGDLPSLLRVVLGVLESTTNRWCFFGKLNLRLVFDYYFDSSLPKGERPQSYYLGAFCLCTFARYFLVQ